MERIICMLLDDLPRYSIARIVSVAWDGLPEAESKRLRALGIDEGALVSTSFRGIFFGKDPIALNIGRMTVAIRRVHARAISVEPATEFIAEAAE